jgi:Glycosyl transferases group 1
MRILLWHVHAAWATAFVSGAHAYLVPVTPDRGPDGRGRARTYPWPDTVQELSPAQLRDADVDVVLLQRPEEYELAARWLGRRPGRDVPAVYVEHNTPKGDVPLTRHPLADRDELTIVHVTHFNDLFWDCGRTRTTVIEHGIPDPGHRYTGELSRLAVVVNEPVRRGRVTGTDLLPRFTPLAPVDVFGMGVTGLSTHLGVAVTEHEDLTQAAMHRQLPQRRAYLHLNRWTSLGLSLLEAMSLGVPAVVLAATEAVAAVPPGAGLLDTRVDTLVAGARRLLAEPDEARALGRAGREWAQQRYGLKRFLSDWDTLLQEVG